MVGNAGVTLAKTIDETTERELERLIAVNLKALVHLAQAAHARPAEPRGSFTVMASNKGLVAQRGSPVYVATKGAAVQLARALALDWAPEGIRVNAICPGLVDTRMLDRFAARSRSGRGPPASWPPSSRSAGSRARRSARRSRSSSPPPPRRSSRASRCPVDGGFTAQ